LAHDESSSAILATLARNAMIFAARSDPRAMVIVAVRLFVWLKIRDTREAASIFASEATKSTADCQSIATSCIGWGALTFITHVVVIKSLFSTAF
jgi:hypothetical protein